MKITLIGLGVVVSAVLAVLKLLGVALTWLIVLAPLGIGIAATVLSYLVAGVVMLVAGVVMFVVATVTITKAELRKPSYRQNVTELPRR